MNDHGSPLRSLDPHDALNLSSIPPSYYPYLSDLGLLPSNHPSPIHLSSSPSSTTSSSSTISSSTSSFDLKPPPSSSSSSSSLDPDLPLPPPPSFHAPTPVPPYAPSPCSPSPPPRFDPFAQLSDRILSGAVTRWALHPAAQRVCYTLDFRYDFALSEGPSRWAVSLRYSQLHALRGWLRTHLPHLDFPPLPRKFAAHLFHSREAIADRRLLALQAFLAFLLSNPACLALFEVQECFSFHAWIPRPMPSPPPLPQGMLYVAVLGMSDLPRVKVRRSPEVFFELSLSQPVQPASGAEKARSASSRRSTVAESGAAHGAARKWSLTHRASATPDQMTLPSSSTSSSSSSSSNPIISHSLSNSTSSLSSSPSHSSPLLSSSPSPSTTPITTTSSSSLTDSAPDSPSSRSTYHYSSSPSQDRFSSDDALQNPLRLLRSPASSDAVSPQFNLEMVFGVDAIHRPLFLQAWDLRTLAVSRHLLAYLQLDLVPLLPHVLYRIRLPLTPAVPLSSSTTTTSSTSTTTSSSSSSSSSLSSSSSSSSPALTCLLHLSPMAIPRPFAAFLPPFRIRTDATRFLPGQVVSGVLHLSLQHPLPASRVHLALSGVQKTRWTTSYTEYLRDPSGALQSRSRLREHGQTLSLLHASRCLWRPKKATPTTNSKREPQDVIPAGLHAWPFEFQLPPCMPPSLKCGVGSVCYALRAAVLSCGKGSFTANNSATSSSPDRRIFLPLKVAAQYQPKAALPPSRAELFPLAGQLRMKVHLQDPVLRLGAQTQLSLFVDNATESVVKHAALSLEVTIVAREPASAITNSTSVPLLTLTEGFPLLPGQSCRLVVPLQVGKKVHPTLDDSALSPLLEITHALVIACDLPEAPALLKIPVVLSHPAPTAECFLPRPPPAAMPPLSEVLRHGRALPKFPAESFSPVEAEDGYQDEDYHSPPILFAPPPVHSVFS